MHKYICFAATVQKVRIVCNLLALELVYHTMGLTPTEENCPAFDTNIKALLNGGITVYFALAAYLLAIKISIHL